MEVKSDGDWLAAQVDADAKLLEWLLNGAAQFDRVSEALKACHRAERPDYCDVETTVRVMCERLGASRVLREMAWRLRFKGSSN